MDRRLAGLWRSPDFLKLWAGQTVSVFGTLITRTALPFTAILILDASPFEVAALGAADMLAGILVGLMAGVWVDRRRRRPLMVAADFGRAALLLTIPLAWALGVLRMEQLFVVAFLTGTLTMLFEVAYQSYLPTLVPRADLVEGNSKLTASASVAEFSAFSLGGWLVQIVSAPLAVLIDAATFILSAAGVLAIRAPEPPPAPMAGHGSIRIEIAEGLRAVTRHRILRPLAASALTEAMARGVIGALVLLYLNRELGFGPGVLGMIFAVGGVTSLLGAVATQRVTRRFGIGPTLILGQLFTAVGTLFLLLPDRASALAVALLILNQCITDPAATMADISATSLRQSVTPDRLLGRVNASIRFASLTLTLVCSLAAGLLAEAIGLRPVLAIGVALYVLPAAILLLSPVRGMREAAAVAPDLSPAPAEQGGVA